MSHSQIHRSRPVLRTLPAALMAALCTLPVQAAEGGAEREDNPAPRLPAVEVRGQRNHADPRPGPLGSATRTATDAREVPQTLQAVEVEQVKAYGGRGLAAALAGVPGISNVSDTRFDAFRIRGFSNAGDTLLDGMRDDAQYVRSLGNIERIEILKGPAAVLYGRGSGGGVINRISKEPGREAFSQASLTWGSYGLQGAAIDWNRPLGEQWALRINAGREHEANFRNEVRGTRQYFAPTLKWESGRDSWLLQANYDEFERTPDRGVPARVTALTRNATASAYALPVASDRSFFGAAGRDFIRDSSLSLRSTITRAIAADWSVRQVVSVFDLNSGFDNTFVSQPFVSAGRNLRGVQRSRFLQNLQHRNVQANLEVLGTLAAGGMQHQLLAGAEYGWQKREPRLWMGSAMPVSLINPDNRNNIGSMPEPWQMNYHKVNTTGLYAQDQIELGAHWKVLAGLRWDHFEVDSHSRLRKLRSERSTHALSPRIGAVWEALPDQHFYASWSKNYAPVGGDVIGITPGASGNANDLGPQFSRQLEVGVKSDWFQRRISTTLAWFQLELYNRTVADPVQPGVFTQTGQERNRGIELSVAGELAPHWFLRGGWTHQNARVLQAEAQFTGKRPSGVSARNGSLFVSYAPPQGWFGETGVVVEGARFADRDNLLELPGYARWDALLGYRLERAEFTLAATNLTNRRYYASATGVSQIVPGAPRALVLTAAYKF
ncbi:iron complex outermembrane receptor protein [Herbaspirillum rubrisubalbicans]|uniref:TonB-dependent receptor n=1 Tax=Herbaspirillum rubrisubalbicans TaxID=80842 RepID=UPI0020A11DD6|nr:TonB-dependent siderophore receptor [Herbaspirillum rubrisubalbicans]MCP1576795.1 iron complex outermembrane receptor protein [Herbaspirillum rubrisubalbicans]